MNDIVERLLNPFPSNRDAERREAAEEIERLREAQEEVITVTADLIARRNMECAGCCGPSAKEDEYEGYLDEAKREIRDAILRERYNVD